MLTRPAGRPGADASVAGSAVLLGLLAILALHLHVPMPPVTDFPNHMARICLLAGAAESGPLSEMYRVTWSAAWTNIGIDAVAAWLAPLTGCEGFARATLAASIALPVAGAVALHAAIHRGLHWWQAGFALIAWNTTALMGFLNFQIGLGLALLLAAASEAWGRRLPAWLRLVLTVMAGAVLVVVHAFAGLFFGALVGALRFGPDPIVWRDRRRLAGRLGAAGLAAVPAFILPALLVTLLAPVRPLYRADLMDIPSTDGLWLAWKFIGLMTFAWTYQLLVDLLFLAALWGGFRLFSRRGGVRCHAGLLLAAFGLFAAALLVPRDAGAGQLLSWRFPVMGLLCLVVGLRPEADSAAAARGAAVALMALSLARTGWIAGIWTERQADAQAVSALLGRIPPGASILPLRHAESPFEAPLGRTIAVVGPAYNYLGVLAVHRRQAFVPTLFALPGIQPLSVLPPWDALFAPAGTSAPVHVLRDGLAGLRSEGWSQDRYPNYYRYLAQWRHFDYALVLNADRPGAGDAAVPAEFELIADTGFARLYRIGGKREPDGH